jgi:hypothetical protein
MPAKYENINVTEELLNSEPSSYFVFGDNLMKQGLAGAAKLRHHPRAIGFVTKKAPDGNPKSCYTPEEYAKPFFDQLEQLSNHIKGNPGRKFYVSKLGAGYANRYYIWETLIHHNLVDELEKYDNVVFCWELEKLTSE